MCSISCYTLASSPLLAFPKQFVLVRLLSCVCRCREHIVTATNCTRGLCSVSLFSIASPRFPSPFQTSACLCVCQHVCADEGNILHQPQIVLGDSEVFSLFFLWSRLASPILNRVAVLVCAWKGFVSKCVCMKGTFCKSHKLYSGLCSMLALFYMATHLLNSPIL